MEDHRVLRGRDTRREGVEEDPSAAVNAQLEHLLGLIEARVAEEGAHARIGKVEREEDLPAPHDPGVGTVRADPEAPTDVDHGRIDEEPIDRVASASELSSGGVESDRDMEGVD